MASASSVAPIPVRGAGEWLRPHGQQDIEAHEQGIGTPLFIRPGHGAMGDDTDAAIAWFAQARPVLDRLMLAHGAVVLRGFAIRNTADFNRVLDCFPGTAFGYAGGGSPRNAIKGKVFESTRTPAEFVIPLHQEMAYLPHHPLGIAFFCEQPSLTGGETIISDFRRFDTLVPAAFRAAIKARGVRYTYNFRAPGTRTGLASSDLFHRPWTEAFSTQDRAEVDAHCRLMGLAFEWQADGSVSTIYDSPGIITHPQTGEEVWFNSIAPLAFTAANFGPQVLAATTAAYAANGLHYPIKLSHADGGELDPVAVDALYPLLDQVTVAFPWQAGDVMLLDNILMAHGRNRFTGPRNVQVGFLR